jgi:hypothetical protein
MRRLAMVSWLLVCAGAAMPSCSSPDDSEYASGPRQHSSDSTAADGGGASPGAGGGPSSTGAPAGGSGPGAGAGPGSDGGTGGGLPSGSPSGKAGCGLDSAALCETFDAPAGTGNRSGQLNGTLWGASRATGAPDNPWATTELTACGSTVSVDPPNDIVVCDGQLHEALDDDGTVAVLAMYPKQPFDFAGRTGKVVFDVSNDTEGNHGAWPEFWITDTPAPAPFTHEASWTAYPINGFGLRFAGCTDDNGVGATCSRGNGAVGVDSAIVVDNYVGNDSFNGGNLKVVGIDSVLRAAPGEMNHYEIDVAQNQIDVYATDGFTGALDLAKTPLHHIATIPNANLSFTRGLIWLEDVHYNANKFGTQRVHTFHWDNVAFDGPVLPRDLTFDIADNTTALPASSGYPDPTKTLGYSTAADAPLSLTVHGVTGIAQAAKALLTLNLYDIGPDPFSLAYSINGHAHTESWPFPWNNAGSPKTLTIPVSLADLTAGDNALTFSASVGITISNVDIILVGAGGVVAP